jgi:hypothetical protein
MGIEVVKQKTPFTISGLKCTSLCGKFGRAQYKWCFTGPKSWDYCSNSAEVNLKKATYN